MAEDEKNITVKHGNPFTAGFKGTLGKGLGCFTLVIIVIIAIAALSSGGDKNKTQKIGDTGQSETSKTSETSQTTIQEEYKVGDVVKLGDREFVVNSTRRAASLGYSTPKAGKEFVVVNVTIKNGGQSEVSYNPFDFKMQDINGAQESESFATLDDSLRSGTLAAGGNVTGSMAFEVPKGTAAKLIFQPSFWSSDRIVVAL